jgi:hypothetical protein
MPQTENDRALWLAAGKWLADAPPLMLGARGIELSANGRPALVSESPCRSFIAAAASPFDLRENTREEMRERARERRLGTQVTSIRPPPLPFKRRRHRATGEPQSSIQATPPPFQRREEKREAWKGERTKRFGDEGNNASQKWLPSSSIFRRSSSTSFLRESGCPYPSYPLNQTGDNHQKSGYPLPSSG